MANLTYRDGWLCVKDPQLPNLDGASYCVVYWPIARMPEREARERFRFDADLRYDRMFYIWTYIDKPFDSPKFQLANGSQTHAIATETIAIRKRGGKRRVMA